MNVEKKNQYSTAVIIPALNEEETIADIVQGASEYGLVIVINDGSTDKTPCLAKEAGAIVVNHSTPKGYDLALEAGLSKAIELKCQFAITIDGDGQHLTDSLQVFKDELFAGADLVVGVRKKYQRISESIFSIFGKYLWGIQDPLCGMKGYRLAPIVDNKIRCTYKSIGTEFALRYWYLGLRIRNVKIKILCRGGQSRFGVGLRPNIKILNALICGLINPSFLKNNKN